MMRISKLALCASVLSVSLWGCGGSSTETAVQPEPKPELQIAATVTSLNLVVSDVEYLDSMANFSVLATNQSDFAVVGLMDLNVKSASQLVPQGASGVGNSSYWQALYNEKKAPAVVTDNLDGTYAISVPLTGLDTKLAQRLSIIAGGAKSTLVDGKTKVAHAEIVTGVNAQGGKADYSRNIVSHQVCSQCHAEGKPFSRRHSNYQEQETCATCHGGLKGKKQWNSLIHDIHNSAQFFTDKKGNEYTGVVAETLVKNNCQACHKASETLTEWNNYAGVPTMETCSSCHSTIDFKAGKGHSQQDNNANCVACHNSQWTTEVHSQARVDKDKVSLNYQVKVQMDVNTDSTVNLVVSVLDTAGQQVDINSLIPYIYRLKASTNVGPNSPVLDYKATDNFKLAKDGKLDASVKVDAGRLMYTSAVLPFGNDDADTAFSFVGLSLCSIQGELVECNAEGSIPHAGVKAGLAFASFSDAAPSRRHANTIEFNNCESCHGETFDIHGTYVVNESMSRPIGDKQVTGVDACVVCHVPGETKQLVDGSYLGALEVRVHQTHKEKASGLSVKDANNCASCHNSLNVELFDTKSAINTGKKQFTTPITAVCSSCHHLNTEDMSHSEGILNSFGAVINGDKKEAEDAAQLETCFNCHKPTLTDHTKVSIQ